MNKTTTAASAAAEASAARAADAASDPDRHPLDLLAESFAEQCRRGERPSVSDYVRRHPQWADELRELLPPIALVEKLKRRNASGAGAGSSRDGGSALETVESASRAHALGDGARASHPPLEHLGDFHIIREIGRGGMGIVYEARQESLGRQVALKVLSRASFLVDPQRLARFEREARAAAALHHTNIVPVFGVGDHEGLHYIVMQFIRGRALNQVIADLAGAGGIPR